MKWKCEICDSYNDESARQCFVCSHPRSAESIKESRTRAREERLSRLSGKVYDDMYEVLKIVFSIGVVLSLICTVVLITIKIANAQLDDIWRSAVILTETIAEKTEETFGIRLTLAVRHITYRCETNADMFGYIFLKMQYRAQESLERFADVISGLYYRVISHLA